MKKSFFPLLLLFASALYGQQRPHYTQYLLNNYILNPALSGIENYTDVRLSLRKQWVGLEGAPQSMYFSVHGPIGKQDYKTSVTSVAMPGENPRGTSYWENYTASEAHHGVGFYMVRDQTGLYNRMQADVSYAYHIGLSPRTNLSAGFSGGVSKIGYDRAKARPVDPNDPALGTLEDIYKLMPDLNAGLWLYSADYFFGVSAQQIIPQKRSFTGYTAGYETATHLFGTMGYRFLLTEDLNVLPSVLVKYLPNSPVAPQFEWTAKMQYRDLLWLGGTYRMEEGFAGMLGVNVASQFSIGYAYDYTTNKLGRVSNGSHELVIGFLIGNQYGDTCPRNLW